jgi:uncharacterized SAM-binding protein YcdF (DUF218 family)
MDSVKYFVEVSLSPVGVMVVLLAGGVLLGVARRTSRTGTRLLVSGALLYLVFTWSPLAEILVGALERDYPPLLTHDQSIRIETVVVLAGYGEEHPVIPVTSNIDEEATCRIAEGIRLHRQLSNSKLLLSGGPPRPGDRPVAGIMADLVRVMGVPESDVIVEGQSRNTYENLLEVKRVVGAKPFILVTSAADLRRAMAVSRKLDMRPLAAPACIWTLQHFPPGMSWAAWTTTAVRSFAYPSAKRLTQLQRAYHEYAGYLWYRYLGRV